MKKLLLKRNYKYILILLFILLLSILIGDTRIISYNFGKYYTQIEVSQNNIENEIDIFNDEILHNIVINLSEKDYEDLILFYKANNEKEYIKTDIIIDGIEIKDVGIKLKGSKFLLGSTDSLDVSQINFSFLIQFDKYISGQNYEGIKELALVAGEIEELKGEYIANKIFQNYGIISPETSFTSLNIGNFISGNYLIKEVVNEDFLTKNYKDTNGIIYKAENSFSFTYLGEDPTLYTDLFTQKTQVNNYDLKKLIEILDFVSNSSKDDFKVKFEKYINLDNYTKFLAITNILYENNPEINYFNSYYIYYDIVSDTIQFIPWDQQYSSSIENYSITSILEKVYLIQKVSNLSESEIREILSNFDDFDAEYLKLKFKNDLENNFLKKSAFENLYKQTEDEIKLNLNNTNFITDLEEKLNNLLTN